MSKSSLQPGTSLGILVGLVFGLVAASLVALYLANTGAPIQTRAQNPSAKINTLQDNTQVPDPNDSLYGKPFKSEIIDPALQLTEKSEEEQQDIKNKIKIKRENRENKTAKSAKEDLTKKKSYTAADANSSETDVAEEKATKNTSSESVTGQDGIDKIASLVTPEATVRKLNNKESDINEEKKREKIMLSQTNNMDSTTNKGERYFVQVGAYVSADDAKLIQSKAENQGIALNVLPREGDGTTLYRVRTKALQPADAERLRNTIKANGMEAQLVKAQ